MSKSKTVKKDQRIKRAKKRFESGTRKQPVEILGDGSLKKTEPVK